MRKTLVLILGVFVVLAWPARAAAQEPIRMGLGFGLTQTSETGVGGVVTFNQAVKDVGKAKIGWVVDLSGTTFGGWGTIIPAGGIRATLPPHGNITFFGQFQFGVLLERDLGEWDTEWGYAPGIGIILARPKSSFNILIQADLGFVQDFLAGPRFLVGIEKKFGK